MKCNNTHCKYYIKAKKRFACDDEGPSSANNRRRLQISVLQEEKEIGSVSKYD